jgi:hypothetical protein
MLVFRASSLPETRIFDGSLGMKPIARFATTLIALATLLFTAGSALADSHEAVADDAMVQMERMVTALGTVTDKVTAEKAVQQLMDVATELKKIAARAKAVGQPSAEIKAKIEAKMKSKQEDFMKKMVAVQQGIAKAGPEAAAVLQKGMVEFGTAMQEVGKAFQDADAK